CTRSSSRARPSTPWQTSACRWTPRPRRRSARDCARGPELADPLSAAVSITAALFSSPRDRPYGLGEETDLDRRSRRPGLVPRAQRTADDECPRVGLDVMVDVVAAEGRREDVTE